MIDDFPKMLPPRRPAQETADRLTNHLAVHPAEFTGAERAAARMVIAALERIANGTVTP